MTQPLVSLIIPGYNCADTLGRAVQSTTSQGLAPDELEIVFVNDCSTDNTHEVATALAEKHPMVVVENEVNLGIGDARNAGNKVASGQYIAYLDSDDWLSDDYLRTCVEAIKGLNVDYIKADHTTVLPDRESHRPFYTTISARNQALSPRDWILPVSRPSIVDNPSVTNGLYRRHLLDSGDLQFDSRLRTAEDRPWTWNLALTANTFAVIDSAGFYYDRTSTTSLTKAVDEKQLDFVLASEIISDRVKRDRDSEKFLPKAVRQLIALSHWHAVKRPTPFSDSLRNELFHRAGALLATFSDQIVRRAMERFGNQRLFELEPLFENAGKTSLLPTNRGAVSSTSTKNAKVGNTDSPARVDVSVIIPAKDGAAYLGTMFRSLLRQFENPERAQIIFINDGSSDDTPEVLEEFAPQFPNFEVITNRSAVGLASGRNMGLDKAQGEYIAFLDGDDWLVDGHLDSVLHSIESLKVDFVRCDHISVTGTSRVLRRAPMAVRKRALRPRAGILPTHESTMIDYPYAWAGMFHRRLLDNGMLYFPEGFMTAEDRNWIWNLHLNAESFAVVDAPGICYRRGLSGSLTQILDDRQLYFIPAFEKIFDLVEADPEAELFWPKATRNWLAILHHQADRFSASPPVVKKKLAIGARRASSRLPFDVLRDTFVASTRERQAAVVGFMPHRELLAKDLLL